MPAGKSILVVEDEADLAELLRYNLERDGYACRCVLDGKSALTEVGRSLPDMILLDRMLPGLSGDEVIAQLKRKPRTAAIPTVMLTAKAEESDALVGFALGADDYVSKPFSMRLLLARIAAIFRRIDAPDSNQHVLSAGPIQVDIDRHELTVDGASISVTAMEFRILRVLLEAKGRVLSRGQMIDTVLGQEVVVTDRTVDVHITSLRKKLGTAGGWIHTVRGVGYALREPVSDRL
ncbi:MAG TPA: response regulator [Phycisphaerae bacterium]|nr:response regulator [Phycisphaerae bacterium]